jgi:plastocyanin
MSRRDALAAAASLGIVGAGALLAGRSMIGNDSRNAVAQEPMNMHAGHAMASPVPAPELGQQPNGSYRWRVAVGGFSAEEGIDTQSYFPGEITINAGDSIFFDFGPGGFHTVTFLSEEEPPALLIPDEGGSPAAGQPRMLLNPDVAFPTGGDTYHGDGYLNSGIDLLRDPAEPFVLTFSQPGAYSYICVPHLAVMGARVIVQETGTDYPYEQPDYDAMAEEQRQALIDTALADLPTYLEVAKTPQSDGSNLWEPTAGVNFGPAQVMKFLPEDLEIRVGDTVRWVNRSPGEGHTVTFGVGGEPPEDFIVEDQGDAPPKITFNPDVLYPAGGAEYDGTGFVSSGFFGEPFGSPTYELTFTVPGTYDYVCLPHLPLGMVGTITVSE